MLWSFTGQCDWWVSASSEAFLKAFTAGLLGLSNLRSALWSNDDCGARLLDELRTHVEEDRRRPPAGGNIQIPSPRGLRES